MKLPLTLVGNYSKEYHGTFHMSKCSSVCTREYTF